MDTMKATRIVGGVCGSLLVFLLIKWGADIIYSPAGGEGDAAEQAYLIEVPDTGDAASGGAAAPVVPFAEYFAVADAALGERVFGKCKSCHTVENGVNRTGPSLFGVVGRVPGTEAGFGGYSDNMVALGGTWTPEELNIFLTRPSDLVDGTTMRFPGLPKPEDRAAVMVYMESMGGAPARPEPVVAEEAPAEEAAAEGEGEAAAEEAPAEGAEAEA